MRSILAVTTPAAAIGLLSIEELRAAAGIGDNSFDTTLTALGLAAAGAIAAECQIAIGAGAEPTLLRERLTETFYGVSGDGLVLARRHDVAVVSLTVDGTLLDAAQYLVDAEAGIIVRLSGATVVRFCAQTVTVVYDAGFATAPADLKRVAADLVRAQYREQVRDPLLKSERISVPDVRDVERQYWVGPIPGQASAGAVPDALASGLLRYRNETLG